MGAFLCISDRVRGPFFHPPPLLCVMVLLMLGVMGHYDLDQVVPLSCLGEDWLEQIEMRHIQFARPFFLGLGTTMYMPASRQAGGPCPVARGWKGKPSAHR